MPPGIPVCSWDDGETCSLAIQKEIEHNVKDMNMVWESVTTVFSERWVKQYRYFNCTLIDCRKTRIMNTVWKEGDPIRELFA